MFFALPQHNFKLAEEIVIEAVKKPERFERSRNDRFIAEKALDEMHLIGVIYEIRGAELSNNNILPCEKE
jgi:hypothetical protein